MTFTADLAEFIRMYAAMRHDEGNPLYMPEALEGLCAVLVATIEQPKVSPDLRAALMQAVREAFDIAAKPASNKALN